MIISKISNEFIKNSVGGNLISMIISYVYPFKKGHVIYQHAQLSCLDIAKKHNSLIFSGLPLILDLLAMLAFMKGKSHRTYVYKK